MAKWTGFETRRQVEGIQILVPYKGGYTLTRKSVKKTTYARTLHLELRKPVEYAAMGAVEACFRALRPAEKVQREREEKPGEVGRDDLLIQYIVAPCGYDPRHAFINGAEIGSVKFKIIIVDGEPQNYPQTAAKGKIISDAGLQWTKKVSSADDEKLEKEIAAIYNASKQISLFLNLG
ncbi:unnamed protein product [Toxocara canis]|uniref:Fumerase_C domain-containing protein n=1 Tax=Toxocara canis TaxID=6265 RepID=A0A183UVZ7_TOXCA|nr:unnamed protein product [Toxocara canis]